MQKDKVYTMLLFLSYPRIYVTYVTGPALVWGKIHPCTVLDTYVCIEVEGFVMHNLGYTGKKIGEFDPS